MEIRLLRAFVVLADCLHYGQAASRLCLTQPALTKQIRVLEDRLGVPLFVRGRHGVALTGFGADFLGEARELLGRADALDLRARHMAKGEAGRLAIGFGLSSLQLAPQCIATFRRHHPDVEISLEDMSSAEQVERLLDGRLQLGFVRLPVPATLASLPLRSDRLVLAVGDGVDPLRPLTVLRLVRQRGPGLAAEVDRLLDHWSGQGFVPSAIHEAGDIQTLLALAAAGIGAAPVPESAMHILPPGVRIVQPEAEIGWQVGLAWRPQAGSPLRDRFIALLR
ncbi:LysR substrate-binding domain-containing protein [Jeongeupia naejangsanensis]|uniref:LysR family transcriptional regulator n=1 Tax=Jeongeupia naejangsanensis TaxID=613195 RepID=A0ABS2BRN9_9NEIS|nr:LysR substrate-binding domain-containing protein [Jeongeupia naejangsanensis]MBM3117469.1 LysR family transcriptional regulator [Jeongeupia naejangsanensis]